MKRLSLPPLRVVVCGAGAISSEYALEHFGPCTLTEVVAVVDLDEKKGQLLANMISSARGKKRRRGSTSCVAYSKSLNQDILAACDLVYVGTPPSSHAALTLAALAEDKHVILEKPLAASSSDGDAIVAAAEKASAKGIHVAVNIGMRYNRALQEMRRIVTAEVTQKDSHLISGSLRLNFVSWPRKWQQQEWCAGRSQGGPLREVGTHFLFAVEELFGPLSIKSIENVTEFSIDDPLASETTAKGKLYIENPGIGKKEDLLLNIELDVTTDGSRAPASGGDLYELAFHFDTSAGEEFRLVLEDFTTLSKYSMCKPVAGSTSADGETLVSDCEYGRKDVILALSAAILGNDTQLASFVTAREARRTQQVLESLLVSDGQRIDL